MKKIIYIVLGCLTLGAGTIGVIIPLLPTVPFYLAAAFFFAGSSERLYNWFIHTKLYEKNLRSYAEGRGMTMGVKLKIICSVTIVMSVGFIMMKDVTSGRSILAVIWVLHLVYFLFGIKTLRE